MAYTDKADWLNIDPATLTEAQRKAWEAVKASWKVQRDAKALFEGSMRAAYPTPQGKKLVFAYNFGKLSVALVDGEVQAAKSSKPTQSLADYLAEAANR